MSWLFGLNKQTPYPGGPPQFPPPPGGDKSDDDTTGEGSDEGSNRGKGGKNPVWANFDPTGLERAAQAARELDKSSKYNKCPVNQGADYMSRGFQSGMKTHYKLAYQYSTQHLS